MINLLLFVLAVSFFFSTIAGIIAFIADVKEFKNSIEFSGSRRQLIRFLMEPPDYEEPEEKEEPQKTGSEVPPIDTYFN